jgi:hypothetical protein
MKRFLLLMGALFLLASCTTEFNQLLNGSRSDKARQTTVFQASVEGCSMPETKVYADENMKVLWNEGDQISIFNLTTLNTQWAFTGEDGDTAGGFEEVQSGGFFTGNPLNYVYAAYPYSKSNKIGNEGVLTMILPAEQNYKEKSFGIGANTMVAITDGSFLAFKNVGGYLSLRLYGDNVSVSRITIKGNNGEKIAGKGSIDIPFGGTPTVTMDGTATDEVSIVCNPAVKIGADANNYTDFWFVIPPVYFSLGFTITVTDDKGGVFERATSKALTINRNTLEWMAVLEVVPDYTNANVQFEDANFKAYCVENFDKDGDGKVSLREARNVEEIDVYCRNNIKSLKGIEFFINLKKLICGWNELTSLDVSQNTALVYLRCEQNKLTSLDVSHNTALQELACFSNELSSLDVSKNTSLTNLTCGWNNITSLDVSHNTALVELGCDANPLKSLDVSHNKALTSLACYRDGLTSLDLSQNNQLQVLVCFSNQLKSLELSHNTELSLLECNDNKLTTLDVSNNKELKSLKCFNNLLTSLDVSENGALSNLDCTNNPFLTEIWLKTGQAIGDFKYDTSVATIKYKD